MSDQILTAADYAEIRGAIESTFTDTVVVEARTRVNTSQGTSYTYSTRSTTTGLVVDLTGYELLRAQQVSKEVSVEAQLPAQTVVEGSDRIRVTNHETGAVRVLEVVAVLKPSREFKRRVLCKEL